MDGFPCVPTGRFAPSPSGRMHAGNIYAALMCWLIVRSRNGKIVLRIDDLDRSRSKTQFADQLLRDFETLGLTWDDGPYYQHDDSSYRDAFNTLARTNHVYPCFCTRADLHAASAPHRGESNVYPGYCRNLSEDDQRDRASRRSPAWRIEVPDAQVSFDDLLQGRMERNLADDCGDFILRRSDGSFAYHLATVVDDAQQGVNLIVRGADLLDSTPQQVFLQEQLGLPRCSYIHIPLFMSCDGRRLSKRDNDASLDEMLETYKSPEGVLGHIAAVAGIGSGEAASATDLLENFSFEAWRDSLEDLQSIPWR